ncbi:MAG: monovalent cation:proton antiporter-2 (CPA2) family protein [Burkholderiaceae bacterium]
MEGLLLSAFIYLGAAVIAVPVARRLGLGSVLGYLVAGVLIGPVAGLVGSETRSLQHVAEFGVVMMLFLVGLELEPRKLWAMRHRLLGLGGLQVTLTMMVIGAAAYALGLAWQSALAIGAVMSLSSTAIVLQTLGEKGLARTAGGEAGFSVLLFQDIAVIPMLALVPLLAIPELQALQWAARDHGAGPAHDTMSLVAGLPAWGVTLVTLGAVAAVVLGGHYLSRPLFRFIAASRLREVFTAAALLLVVSIALLMTLVGLSPALGTFLAGVVLANSEFRHELESDIEPFKGLLLGLFFITVGAGIDFELFFAGPWLVLGLTLGVILIKALVLLVLGWIFGLRGSANALLGLGLAQAGEFGFVLLGFTERQAVLAPEPARLMLLVVALSMMLTPVLFIVYDRVLQPWLDRGASRDPDEIDIAGPVIIAGHGRFGQIINRLLLSNGFKTVVLDHQVGTIDNMRRFGVRAFYGDASRPDLLHAAGIETAAVLVVAIDDRERATQIVRHARRLRADLHIVVRARDRTHCYELYEAGANDIIRELFDSSVRAARNALEALGMHPFRAEQAARAFVRHDRRTLAELAAVWDPQVSVFENPDYLRIATEREKAMEALMQGDSDDHHDRTERGWMPPPRPVYPPSRR